MYYCFDTPHRGGSNYNDCEVRVFRMKHIGPACGKAMVNHMDRQEPREPFLYKRIYQDIRDQIEEGKLTQGQALPQGNELAKEYKVSAITITKALDELRKDGYLRRVKGKGSFIQLPVKKSHELTLNGSALPESGMLPNQTKEQGEESALFGKVEEPVLIGVVLEHVSSCFGLDLLYKLDLLAQEAGYRVCVRFSYGERKKETEEILFLRRLGVKGMIVMPCHGQYYNMTILQLVIEKFPIVLIDKHMEGIPVSSVRTDGYLAMKELVDYLVQKGKKRIGFISMSADGTSSVQDRRKGFRDGVKAAGIVKPPECFLKQEEKIDIFSEQRNEEHIRQMEAFLKKNKGLEAVICAEFGIARSIKEAIRRAGLSAPEVCTVDEDYHAPDGFSFTHVRQDEAGIAAKAFHILKNQIEDHKMQQGDYLIPGMFREREK